MCMHVCVCVSVHKRACYIAAVIFILHHLPQDQLASTSLDLFIIGLSLVPRPPPQLSPLAMLCGGEGKCCGVELGNEASMGLWCAFVVIKCVQGGGHI